MTTSNYEEHPLRNMVQRMLDMRNMSEFSLDIVASNQDYSFARDKAFAITQALQDFLINTPAELVSSKGLDAILAQIQTPLNELSAFTTNRNPSHITNAASKLDQAIIPLFWAFTPLAQITAESTFPAILKTQSDFSQGLMSDLAERKTQLEKSLAESIEKSEALAKKLDEVAEGAARERAEASATVAKLDQAFTQAESARQVIFDAVIAEQQRLHKEEMESEISTAGETLEELKGFHDDAARIVQVVGNIGVTGNYQRIAISEGKSANFWRWATVIIFGAGIAIALATFYKFWHEPFSQDTAVSVLIRLFYAIVITSPAIYTARESARHRTNADRARQTELELASIGPFIELLPEDSKVAIRTGLTQSYFGRATEAHTISSPLDPEHFKNLLEMLKAAKPG